MGFYEIIVESHIDEKRARDFDKLEFKYLPEGRTLIWGTLADQSELFYIMSKIRDMNLTLVSVRKLK